VLFVGWFAYFVFMLIRFRAGRRHEVNRAGTSGRMAMLVVVGVVVAESVLLVGSALQLFFDRAEAVPMDASAIVIRVVAQQFQWNVHYPGADGQFGETSLDLVSDTNPIGLDRTSPFGRDDLVLTSEIHVPVNRQVIIQLSSKDVIHSFGVPAMRVKQDAIPGLRSPVWFTPTETGEFEVACSQLCGAGHYRMKATITVESGEAYQRFLATEAEAQLGR
jgi:cytochrome c oxidase subunit 2